MDLCFFVSSIVLVMVSSLTGNLIFKVVIVLAMFKALSTLKFIPYHINFLNHLIS